MYIIIYQKITKETINPSPVSRPGGEPCMLAWYKLFIYRTPWELRDKVNDRAQCVSGQRSAEAALRKKG